MRAAQSAGKTQGPCASVPVSQCLEFDMFERHRVAKLGLIALIGMGLGWMSLVLNPAPESSATVVDEEENKETEGSADVDDNPEAADEAVEEGSAEAADAGSGEGSGEDDNPEAGDDEGNSEPE